MVGDLHFRRVIWPSLLLILVCAVPISKRFRQGYRADLRLSEVDPLHIIEKHRLMPNVGVVDGVVKASDDGNRRGWNSAKKFGSFDPNSAETAIRRSEGNEASSWSHVGFVGRSRQFTFYRCAAQPQVLLTPIGISWKDSISASQVKIPRKREAMDRLAHFPLPFGWVIGWQCGWRQFSTDLSFYGWGFAYIFGNDKHIEMKHTGGIEGGGTGFAGSNEQIKVNLNPWPLGRIKLLSGYIGLLTGRDSQLVCILSGPARCGSRAPCRLGTFLRRPTLGLHLEHSIERGNIVTIQRISSNPSRISCGVCALFSGLELHPRYRTSYEGGDRESGGKFSDDNVRPSLSDLRPRLYSLKTAKKFLVLALAAISFGLFTFRQLGRVWKKDSPTPNWGIVFFLIIWFCVGQGLMYLIAVWIYPDL